MPRLPLSKLFIFFVFTLSIIVFYRLLNDVDGVPSLSFAVLSSSSSSISSSSMKKSDTDENKKIFVSFVVCDSRFNESLNIVKSVLIFTNTPVRFVIFADDELRPKFNEVLTQWQTMTSGQLEFELHEIHFPRGKKDDWINLFRKCASQRLFIPEIITHIEKLIYVDTDSLFLGPADELWDFFSKFNATQMSAMALEQANPNLSWYPRFAKHPFYGKLGLQKLHVEVRGKLEVSHQKHKCEMRAKFLSSKQDISALVVDFSDKRSEIIMGAKFNSLNSGVMLMNLTRMREFGWTEYLAPIMQKWKLYIPYGDQDIINIIFHHHGNRVLELSCRYNYRSDQCMYGDECPDATRDGVFLMHGSRKVFHNHKQPAFEAVYRAIEEYEVGSDPTDTFLPNLQKYLKEAPQSNCGNLKDAFLKVPVETLTQDDVEVKPEEIDR